MAKNPESNEGDAVGRSPVERRAQASHAANAPPSTMSQTSATKTGLGITPGRDLGPGFVTENLGKLMGLFFILLILGILAYAFAPKSWLGL